MLILLLSVAILIAAGAAEAFLHSRRRDRIPLRIWVNGSRGKSSVTRLIAAGLNAGGICTCAKTTGSAACLILPDGRERNLRKRGGADIREQIKVIRQAACARVQAVVIECMSLRPHLQKLEGHRLIRPHISVLTAITPDHLDIMGPGIEDVIGHYLSAVPAGDLFIGPSEHTERIRSLCKSRHLAAIWVDMLRM